MRCSVEFQAAVARRIQRLQLDFEFARAERPLHLLLAQHEGVAEDAGAAEVGVLGTEVEVAVGATQPGADRHRRRCEGRVADDERDGAVAGLRGDPGGRVFEDALFGFFCFDFFAGFFVAQFAGFSAGRFAFFGFVFEFARFGFLSFFACLCGEDFRQSQSGGGGGEDEQRQ
jgi:hypothetical protein